MGYTTLPVCSIDLDTPQLPRAVWRVRVLAGFTPAELAEAVGLTEIEILCAEGGDRMPLLDRQWRTVLEVCGKRAFDVEPT